MLYVVNILLILALVILTGIVGAILYAVRKFFKDEDVLVIGFVIVIVWLYLCRVMYLEAMSYIYGI